MKILFRNTMLILFIIVLTSLSACSPKEEKKPPLKVETKASQASKVSFLACGDNLIHTPIFKHASMRVNGKGYDFLPAYQNVAASIKNADLSFINQETPLGGTQLGITSYPSFNSPQELGDDLIRLGFDIVNHANNHILDKGEKSIKNTIDYWHNHPEVLMIGAYPNEEEQNKLHIIEKNDIKIGFLSYTYGTNGILLPKNSPYRVSYIDETNIKTQITKLKNEVDIVMVSMHWGDENITKPSTYQKKLAGMIAEAGADVIIGHHPHVIQPIEWINRLDGKQTLVVYSLGNFISGQQIAANMLGGMVTFEIMKESNAEKKSVTLSNVRFIPTLTHYNGQYWDMKIYPFAAYTKELATTHGCIRYDKRFSYNYIDTIIKETIAETFFK